MIVGPDEDTRVMLRAILEIWDYDVLEAASPDESLTLVNDRTPSLILLDTTIRFKDSLHDLSKFKQNCNLKNTPSIMMSGFSQPAYREAAINNGASGFLPKPLDFDVLRVHIETLASQQHYT
jgi:two-component system response regulator HydG